jgi:uncharacterized protein (DUF697 family)
MNKLDKLIWQYTAVAAATGAVPVPAVTAALVAENTAMIAAIAKATNQPVTPGGIIASLGTVGSMNMLGRAVFVEAARLLGWAAGPLGIAGVSAIGASTAALQTWLIGQLAVAVAENGGLALPGDSVQDILLGATQKFKQVASAEKK